MESYNYHGRIPPKMVFYDRAILFEHITRKLPIFPWRKPPKIEFPTSSWCKPSIVEVLRFQKFNHDSLSMNELKIR